jgi:hypothetical protein
MKADRTPILVTGAQRSGTTWVGRTISQHPSVRYEHEPFNTFDPNPMFGLKINDLYSHYESSGQQPEIREAFDRLLFSGRIRESVNLCRAKGLSRYTPAQFFRQLFSTPRQRILLKDPVALLSADWLYRTYPCRVVCMIRNPLGFAASQKKAGWDMDFDHLRRQEALMRGRLKPFSADLERVCAHPEDFDLLDRAALLWNVLYSVVLAYKKEYPQWLFLRHEDVARSPHSAFRKVFDFLDLELTPAIQEYIAAYTSSQNSAHARSTKYQPRDSRALVHAWKEILTRDESARVDAQTRKIASRFYDDEELCP